MTRQERILQLPFFQDKQELAQQIIQFERTEHIYLPDQFIIKQVPPYTFGEKKAAIGRIHEFYFVGICRENQWKYQAFKDEMKCREFFVSLPNITDQQLAFWFNNIELLKTA
ncbi:MULTISPECIES: DUF3964 family protein [Bacillus cereus group]|uniref:DUF3964 family protein n=1 Tax=Bacillus cereus group TaxID=86661 RepID=UPI000864350B|nr:MULTISPECIES: DUF3964 family protein [Bacillus cereus group]AWC28307.1 DUF3964 domain-containing protein [Bacillus cytotoxicus]AWC40308.1 DUF3964 domain-containing protein [Bacillus cytotoxicus]AWC48239.1 DUF3964 domain-containing protein [Bacillus cytotoxicus]AWC52374.1 DUF3964 domain-containing protein [Bacillus cytotoxicus]AWC56508.1 DUF3964 domain-containing protein [Bacillus cytotoxicus]